MVAGFLAGFMSWGRKWDVGSCSTGTVSAAIFSVWMFKVPSLRRVCICICREPSGTNTGPLKPNFWFGFLGCHNSSTNAGSNLYELRLVIMNSPEDFCLSLCPLSSKPVPRQGLTNTLPLWWNNLLPPPLLATKNVIFGKFQLYLGLGRGYGAQV